MKIVISTSSFGLIDSSPINLLKSKGIDLVINPYGRTPTEKEIIELLHNADGLIAGLEILNKNVFKNSPKLKAISRVGIGLDNIDLHAAKRASIKISYTPDAPTESVAELTIASALTLSRNIIEITFLLK